VGARMCDAKMPFTVGRCALRYRKRKESRGFVLECGVDHPPPITLLPHSSGGEGVSSAPRSLGASGMGPTRRIKEVFKCRSPFMNSPSSVTSSSPLTCTFYHLNHHKTLHVSLYQPEPFRRVEHPLLRLISFNLRGSPIYPNCTDPSCLYFR